MSLLSIICGNKVSGQILSGGVVIPDPPPPSISYAKNPLNSEDTTTYDAFGFIERTGTDRLTYFARSGSTHLVGGRPYYRHYTISTGTWDSKVFWDTDTLDFRDVWGGAMDNGEIILFTSTTANNTGGGNWSSNVFFRKCGTSSMTFSSRTSIPLTLERGTFFGKITYMGTAGHYAIILNEYDVTTPGAVLVSAVITTDYFNTYTKRTVYSGATWFTESCIAYLGSGKMCVISRAENLGHLHYWESTDSGVTWTDRGATNLGWYTNSDKIPFLYMHDGLLDVIFTDRDSLCIAISKNNDPAVFFGAGNTGKFNAEEIYFYNYGGSSSNPNLGYASLIKIAIGQWMVCWTRETAIGDANIWYSLDDMVTDAAPPPAPPAILTNYIGVDYIRYDITDYDSHMKDIRYFQIDVSTDPAFGSFISAKVNSSAATAQSFQNIRMKGPSINVYGLSAATTYYARIRAVNNAGASAYTTKTTITTGS